MKTKVVSTTYGMGRYDSPVSADFWKWKTANALALQLMPEEERNALFRHVLYELALKHGLFTPKEGK